MPDQRGRSGEEIDEAGARAIACRVLAVREHSCHELNGKLLNRGVPEKVARSAVNALRSEGLVDDLRFTESFTRSRISRMQGPLRIRAELTKKGVSTDLIEQSLALYDEQWPDLALEWVQKRSGPGLDRKQMARLYRSGMARGFTHQHMMSAIRMFEKGV